MSNTKKTYRKYRVYYRGGGYAGTSVAVSPEKAVNNVRWMCCDRYTRNEHLYAVEVEDDQG